MPTFELEFEVYCECGAGLCSQSSTRTSLTRSSPQVIVEPCSRCTEKARDDGYTQGYQDGQEES